MGDLAGVINNLSSNVGGAITTLFEGITNLFNGIIDALV